MGGRWVREVLRVLQLARLSLRAIESAADLRPVAVDGARLSLFTGALAFALLLSKKGAGQRAEVPKSRRPGRSTRLPVFGLKGKNATVVLKESARGKRLKIWLGFQPRLAPPTVRGVV